MHIEVTFADGTTARHHVEPVVVKSGGHGDFVRGWAVGADEAGCDTWTDFLLQSLADQGLREGQVDAEEEGDVAFSWRLVGTERDFCLDRLQHWVEVLGADTLRDLVDMSDQAAPPDRVARAAGLSKGDRRRVAEEAALFHWHLRDLDALLAEALPSPGP